MGILRVRRDFSFDFRPKSGLCDVRFRVLPVHAFGIVCVTRSPHGRVRTVWLYDGYLWLLGEIHYRGPSMLLCRFKNILERRRESGSAGRSRRLMTEEE